MSPLIATLLQLGLLVGFAIATIVLVAGYRDAPLKRGSSHDLPTDPK